MNVDLSLGHTQRIMAAAASAGLSVQQTAYVLATAYWETARTMQPVREAYYLGEPKAENYRRRLRYYPWYGRGFGQLTWQDNYQRAGTKIGVNLIANPDAAMEPDNAARILVLGSKEGWFTGKKLSEYIYGRKSDYVNARRIINGIDKAGEIAAIARQYEAALRDHNPAQPIPAPAGKIPGFIIGGLIAAVAAIIVIMKG